MGIINRNPDYFFSSLKLLHILGLHRTIFRKDFVMPKLIRVLFLFLMLPELSSYAGDLPADGTGAEAKASSKIIGGTESKTGDWPWMVALLKSNDSSNYSAHFCGGSLIAPRWVLTAAHCVVDSYGRRMYSPSELNVLTGANDLSTGEGQRVGVKRIIVHPEYDSSNHSNDIALIELRTSVNTETLPIYDGEDDLEGLDAIAIGWGNTSSDGNSYPYKLRQVTLPIVSNFVCNESYQALGTSISDCMMCAGYAEGGRDTCDGDSGGPLVISEDSEWKLAGVTSWGEGCAQPGYYGVYSRISKLKSFVASYVTTSSQDQDENRPETGHGGRKPWQIHRFGDIYDRFFLRFH